MRGLRALLATAVAAAVVFAFPALASAGDLTLEVSGDCPGQLTLRWSGAEPRRPMAICFSPNLGSFRMPNGGPCAGTLLGLSGTRLRIVSILRSGSDGSGLVSGESSKDVCGGYLQLVVHGSVGLPCQTSNVVQVTE